VELISNFASVVNSVKILFFFPSFSFSSYALSTHRSLHLNFFKCGSSIIAAVGVVSKIWNLWKPSYINSFSIIIRLSSLDPISDATIASGNQLASDSYHIGTKSDGATTINGPGTKY